MVNFLASHNKTGGIYASALVRPSFIMLMVLARKFAHLPISHLFCRGQYSAWNGACQEFSWKRGLFTPGNA